MSDVLLALAVICQTLALMFALSWWQFIPNWVILENGKPPVLQLDFTNNKAWVKGKGERKSTDFLSYVGEPPRITERGLILSPGVIVTVGEHGKPYRFSIDRSAKAR